MQWEKLSSPPTYEDALRIARGLASAPDTLVPYPHEGLENARHGRGFAFLDRITNDRGETVDGYVLATTTGHRSGVFWEGTPDIDAVIAEHLAEAEHNNRDIPDSELSVAHRVALEAYDLGLTRIDEAPGRPALDAETADYAEYILLVLRHNGGQGMSGRKILAHNDFLLSAPDPGRRYTQPCPRCKQPTSYNARYPLAVCRDCLDRATDRAGRRITGYNVSMSGGMIAYYTDTIENGSPKDECVEVTRTGECLIDGRPAIMDEARFGGIIVQMASPEPRSGRLRRWFGRP